MFKKSIIYFFFFCLILAWFFFRNPWYPGATLFVSGIVPVSDTTSNVAVRWESGNGLNGYEMNRFTLQPMPEFSEDDGFLLKITRTGESISDSSGSKVFLSSILLDGKEIKNNLNLPDAIETDGGLLKFKQIGTALEFSIKPLSHLRIEFLAFNRAGIVEVNVGGENTRHNLYDSNYENKWSSEKVVVLDFWFVSDDGQFIVNMGMPRYPVNTYRFESKEDFSLLAVNAINEYGQVIPLSEGPPAVSYSKTMKTYGANFAMAEVNVILRRFFHPQSLATQIGFALLTTWIFSGIVSFLSKMKGIKGLFVQNKRYYFWTMLVMGFCVFFLWQLAFWPAIMSTDSLKIWRAAHIPGLFLGDHPVLNVLLYQYLAYFWDNIAIVPLAQNFLTSLLVAYVFFSFYRWGIPGYVLIPSYLLVIFSLPVGLYNTVMWKDIPFALLTVYIGFRLADICFQKRYNILVLTWQSWLVLFLLVLALAGLRHNGVIFLIATPLILVAIGVVRGRTRLLYALVGALLVAGLVLSVVKSQQLLKNSYFLTQTRHYVDNTAKKVSFKSLKKSSIKYLGIFNVNQDKAQWDHVHLCFYGRYNNDFLRATKWNDVYPYIHLPRSDIQKKLADTMKWFYWKSYQKPWVYLSWNPIFMLLIIPILPFFFRLLPMTSVFSFFVLVQVAALVFFNIFNWRYYYFFYFALFFIIPMIISDFTRKRRLAMG